MDFKSLNVLFLFKDIIIGYDNILNLEIFKKPLFLTVVGYINISILLMELKFIFLFIACLQRRKLVIFYGAIYSDVIS